jgi:hypothetical protein
VTSKKKQNTNFIVFATGWGRSDNEVKKVTVSLFGDAVQQSITVDENYKQNETPGPGPHDKYVS